MALQADLARLTRKELDQALAIANRTRHKPDACRIIREYRRRQIRIPRRLYWWSRQQFGKVD